jgi:hypothetical protein
MGLDVSEEHTTTIWRYWPTRLQHGAIEDHSKNGKRIESLRSNRCWVSLSNFFKTLGQSLSLFQTLGQYLNFFRSWGCLLKLTKITSSHALRNSLLLLLLLLLLLYKSGPPLWSSGLSSWLQIRRPGFDSRHYQKKKSSGSGTGSTQPREYKLRSYLIEK